MHGMSPQNSLTSTPHNQPVTYGSTAVTTSIGPMRSALHSTLGHPSVSKTKRKSRSKTTTPMAYVQSTHSHYYLAAPKAGSALPAEMDSVSLHYYRQGLQHHQYHRSLQHYRQRNSSDPQHSSLSHTRYNPIHPSQNPPSPPELDVAGQHDSPSSNIVNERTSVASGDPASPIGSKAIGSVSEPPVHAMDTKKSLVPVIPPRRTDEHSSALHFPSETSHGKDPQPTPLSSTAADPISSSSFDKLASPHKSYNNPQQHQQSNRIEHSYSQHGMPKSSHMPSQSYLRGTVHYHPLDRMVEHHVIQSNSDIGKHAIHPVHPGFVTPVRGDSPTPTKPVVSCLGPNPSEVRFRSYSGHLPELRKCFQILQERDQGYVEQRTIAFSANLVISRWEPSERTNSPPVSLTSQPTFSAESTTAREDHAHISRNMAEHASHMPTSGSDVPHDRTPVVPSSSSPSPAARVDASPNHKSTTQVQAEAQSQQSRNPAVDPVYAARFVSMANYIRHIVVLTSSPLASSQRPHARQRASQLGTSTPKSATFRQESFHGHHNTPLSSPMHGPSNRQSSDPTKTSFVTSSMSTTPHSPLSTMIPRQDEVPSPKSSMDTGVASSTSTTSTSTTTTNTVGPIKTDASRKYYRRVSSEYQGHSLRRQLYHRPHLHADSEVREGETLHVAEALEKLRDSSTASTSMEHDASYAADSGYEQSMGGDRDGDTPMTCAPPAANEDNNTATTTETAGAYVNDSGLLSSSFTAGRSDLPPCSQIQLRRAQHKPPLTISTDFTADGSSSATTNPVKCPTSSRATPNFTPAANTSLPSTVKHTDLPTVLNIPFPNLTLTLALIYIDRLKSKYPDARGEPGCSHRLFLVAYIIAAKYRCSVELAHLASMLKEIEIEQELELERRHAQRILQPDAITGESDLSAKIADNGDEDRHFDDKNNGKCCANNPHVAMMSPTIVGAEEWANRRAAVEKKLEKAEQLADLVFSNHAWTRLLNFGVFSLSPPSTPSPSANAASTATTPNTNNNTTTPSASSSLVSSTTKDTTVPQPSSTNSNNAAQKSDNTNSNANKVTVLQVEDLDRMEVEFLTFLNCDLSAHSRDLQTCWHLLVGA